MRPVHCIEGSRRLFGRRASNPQAATLLAIAALFSSVGLLMLLSRAPAHAQTDTDAAQSSLSIAIFVNSRNDRCFDSGEVAAINHLAKAEQDRINASGGILRRRLELQILDDKRAPDRAIANVKGALANPRTVAMIGLSGDRANAAFDAVGSLPVGHQRQQRLRKAEERIHDASLAR
jgi:hypothetical protein